MSRKIPPLDLERLPITYQKEIPDSYRDEMGHMNVMWYTHLFSCAFDKFGDLFGMNEAYFLANHAGSFALEAHIRFLNEVHIGRHVTVRSRLLGRSAKRYHFMHFMTIDETGALASFQEHVAAHIDMHERRMAPFPPDLAARFDAVLAEHNALGWDAPVCGVMRP
ncbi:MAG: thioesterase family protein [Pirellulales bacterium]